MGRLVAVVAPIVMALLCAPIAVAAPGDLDPTFSGDGKEVTDLGGEFNGAADSAIQPDGKIVVAGIWDDPSTTGREFALVRYNVDGTLDSGFSGDGVQTTDFDSGGANGVVIQSDGKIVAVGGSNLNSDFSLARYNSDGSLDTTFSEDGRQTSDFGELERATDIAVQPDGKLVVLGSRHNDTPGSSDVIVARYNADGSLDTGFSGDGFEITDFGGNEGAAELALQPDGRIVVVGSSELPLEEGSPPEAQATELLILARYNPDGSLDTSFSGDGKVAIDEQDSISGSSIALQPDGKIVVAGTANPRSENRDFGLVRFNADGSLDTNFGLGGRATADFDTNRDSASSVAVQSNGKIVAVGGAGDPLPRPSERRFALARFSPDGALDPSFSGDGKQIVEFAGDDQSASSVVIQSDGKIVASGTVQYEFDEGSGDEGDFAVARFEGDFVSLDSDGDGVPDSSDACPAVAGTSANGCPAGDGGGSGGGGGGSGGGGDTSGGSGGNPPAESPPGGDGGSQTGGPPPGGTGGDPPVAAPAIAGPRSAGTARVSVRGTLTVPRQLVDCTGPGPDCRVSVGATGSVPAGEASASAKRRKVKLGRSTFKVKAGRKGRVTLKLTRRGVRLVKRLKRIKTTVRIVVRRGGITKRKAVRVTLKAPVRRQGGLRR